MSALICGSLAYDNIMAFPDRFGHHILPDKINALDVCFMVPKLQREFGGCAGNIAFNLNMLGGDVVPMGTVGKDFDPYRYWMHKRGIDQTHLQIIDHAYTAQAFITTDLDGNQITFFHPGAMNFSHEQKVFDTEGVSISMISPDGREGMIQHADQCVEVGIPFVFDPGQGLPMFDADDLENFFDQAHWVIANDYEWHIIQERTGMMPMDLTQRVGVLIVTQGASGSLIYTKDKTHQIPSATPTKIDDPTGCGDAYRAGLLCGLMNDMNWEITGRIASLMGTINIESHGTQNHSFTLDDFKTRFAQEFSMSF